MKKKILAALLLAVAMLVMGCGSTDEESSTVDSTEVSEESSSEDTEESSEESTDVPESSEPEEEEDEATVITERVEVDGQMQSYLTGEWKDVSVVTRRNFAVIVPNNEAALPQYGISAASIIYEAPVEGRITRLMLLVEDYDDLDMIGPVRSARDYYVYEAMAYDSLFCHWGLTVLFAGDLINSDRIDNISAAVSGIDTPASEAFFRRTRSGYKTAYTAYMDIEGYTEAVERLGYETEYRDTFEQAFTFAADGHEATYDEYESATVIYPGGTSKNSGGYGWGSDSPYFVYNEEDGLYYRYEYGEAQVDEMNGEQLAVTNVVFKICHGEERTPGTEYDYLAFGVHGTGDAIVFTAGKVITGTWSRESDTAANIFYDEDGNEIIFNQGKTWICCIWEEYSEYMMYE